MSGPARVPQGEAGLGGRLAAGAAGKAMTLAVQFGEQILLVPVFLLFWGPARYGDWLAMLSAAGFLVLLDLGLQTYYANAFQMALARGDRDGFTRLLHQALGVYGAILAIALPAALLAALLVPWPAALNMQSVAGAAARAGPVLLALHMLIALPFGAVVAIYRAHGQFALGIMAGNLMRLALAGGAALALWLGAGIAGVAAVYAAVPLLGWVVVVADLRRRYAPLRFGVRLPDGAALSEAARIAPLYALIPAAATLTVHGTVILISTLAAAGGAVVVYTTTRTLTGIVRLASDQITQVTGVEMARQHAQDARAELGRLYAFVARLTGALSGALAGFAALIGPPFLAVWTLGRVAFDPLIFWPLLAAAGLSGPSLAGASALLFINRPHGLAAAHVAAGLLTVALSAALIPGFGAAGAAWAVLAAEAGVLSLAVPWVASRAIGGSALRRIATGQGCAALACGLSAGLAWAALQLFGGESLWRLLAAAALWTVLIAPPLFFVLFSPGQRRGIAARIRPARTTES